LPVVLTLGSGSARQYQLQNHYPAVVMAGMTVGMVEALGCHPFGRRPGWWHHRVTFAGLLLLLTLAAHGADGFLYFGRRYHPRVGRPHGTGPLILEAARHIPKEGVLVVPFHLGGVCANRRDILSWKHYDPDRHGMDMVFCRLSNFGGGRGKRYRELLEGGRFGVRYFDGRYVLLQKDWPADRNPEVREAGERAARTISLVRTMKHAGSNRADRDGEGVRHWKPGRKRPPAVVAFGKGIPLDEGRYRAVLEFRSAPPRDGGDWGRIELLEHGTTNVMAESPVAPSDNREYRRQVLAFSLAEPARVEPRITGGHAPLWLMGMEFIREQGRRNGQGDAAATPGRLPSSKLKPVQ
jgi:hypothetical protein